MLGVSVDGTDFFAVHEAARQAVERARDGGGPTASEARAHPWFGHLEGDTQLYRTPEQVAELRRTKDPLLNFRAKVDSRKASAKELDSIEEETRLRVDDAVAKARAAAYPEVENLLTDVYGSY